MNTFVCVRLIFATEITFKALEVMTIALVIHVRLDRFVLIQIKDTNVSVLLGKAPAIIVNIKNLTFFI